MLSNTRSVSDSRSGQGQDRWRPRRGIRREYPTIGSIPLWKGEPFQWDCKWLADNIHRRREKDRRSDEAGVADHRGHRLFVMAAVAGQA